MGGKFGVPCSHVATDEAAETLTDELAFRKLDPDNDPTAKGVFTVSARTVPLNWLDGNIPRTHNSANV
jgi:hypothetical protein